MKTSWVSHIRYNTPNFQRAWRRAASGLFEVAGWKFAAKYRNRFNTMPSIGVQAHENGTPVTQYHENKVVYGRRRAPRRIRRRMRRKARSFIGSLTKLAAPQRILRTYSFTMSSLANKQGNYSILMNTIQNSDTIPNNGGTQGDDMFQLWNTVKPTSGVASTSTNNRLMLQHTHMDVMFSNGGANAAYLEIFYVSTRTEHFLSPNVAFNNIDTNVWGANPALDSATIGVTPYDSRDFTEHYIINKVRRIILPPGQVTEISLSDRKKRFIDPRKFLGAGTTASSVISKPGWTTGIMVTVMGAGLDNTNFQPTSTANVNVYVNKMYQVVIPPGANAITSQKV